MQALAVALAAALLAQSQETRERMGEVPRLDNPDNNIRKTDREIKRDRSHDKEGGFGEKHTGFSVHVAPDGSVRFKDRGARASGLGATFDLTDWAMRMHGEDPYQFQKNKFLNDTVAERSRMAVTDRKQRLRRALADLPDLLQAIATARDLDARARRSVIFQLWDDCAEKGESEVVETARHARSLIVSFVRDKLPAGGVAAFSPQDLAALNAHRKSAAAFDPYAKLASP